jgi:CO/xanthine dehydrogenase Mo-binding subunit/CTP:molybdopterin cytidylyltransferase MocA
VCEITGLILAAGFSSRMGRFKPLLDFDGAPAVCGIARKLLAACRRVIVVTGHRESEVRSAFARAAADLAIEFVFNPRFENGMFSSLQIGVRAAGHTEWLLYHHVDQPHLPPAFYPELIGQIAPETDVVQPYFNNQPGHPLLLASPVVRRIADAPVTTTLRDVLADSDLRRKFWTCAYPEILQDADTPAEWHTMTTKPLPDPPIGPVARSDHWRADARDKFSGRTRYIRDTEFLDLWHGVTVRSPHAHARIRAIRLASSIDWKDIAIVTARDVPYNIVALPENDMPFIAGDVVNYIGEPVALVAAPTCEQAIAAAAGVEIEYEPLTPLFEMLDAERSDVRIFKSDNIFKSITIVNGDMTAAAARADHVIEQTAETGYQEHLYLEPQGIVAIPERDRVVIHGSMQCPTYILKALMALFADKLHVCVVQSPTGGAFGGKEDFPSLLAGHAALLAVKCGHPVAMFYERAEDVLFTTKRHPSHHADRAYVARDGRLLGLDLRFHFDGGAYCTLSPVVLARGALAACGSYFVPAANIQGKAVATNHPPSGAFRGFGGPQTVFAIEMLMEKIALDLGLSPATVREQNLIVAGQATATGQVLRESLSARETFEDVIARADYHHKYRDGRAANAPLLERLTAGVYPKRSSSDVLRGIGIASWLHGAGFTGTGENRIKGTLRLGLTVDGRPVVYAASTEMGQGQYTAFQLMAARALSINPADVIVATPDTDVVPDTGPTVASRTTMIAGSLIVAAAEELIRQLCSRLAGLHGQPFVFRDGAFRSDGIELSFREAARLCPELSVERRYQHPPEIQFDEIAWKGDAYPVYSWGAAVAEIEVDPITFETRVTRYTTTQDIGRAINPDQAIAQIQGGTLQGIGHALYERIRAPQGRMDVTGFTDYIIPTLTETPVFDVKLWENPYSHGPFGAKGLGELPFVGAAPAVVSALWMIFQRPFTRIPVLPEDLAAIFHPASGAAS